MRAALALALLLAAAGACTYVPVEVETDATAKTGRTWAWLPRPPVARGDASFAEVDDRVRASVARELGARRLKKVERERPDYLVTYYAALDKPIAADSITYAAGVPLVAKAVSTYERGSLVLDVLDPKTGRLLWRGAARRVFLPDQTPQQRGERIDAAAASLVDQLVPD
jgi:hypothetical protein